MDGICQAIAAMSSNTADMATLITSLRSAEGMMAANVASIPAAVQSLDPLHHSLGICALLVCQARAAMDAPTNHQFLDYTGGFLKACAASQVQQVSAQFCELCRRYKDKLIDAGRPRLGLLPLLAALRKLAPNTETLTPLHADFLQLALLSKCYNAAAPLLAEDILAVDPVRTALVPSDLLLYCFYGGMVATGRKQYGRALELYLQALTAPTGVASAITAECYKKYVLVALLHTGALPPLPKFASPKVKQMIETECRTYNDLASAFGGQRAEAVRRIATDKAAAFAADGNGGLLRLALQSLTQRNIQRLTATYVTLSLQDIAAAAGLGSAAAAEAELLRMIQAGVIHAAITQADGMVRFLEEPERYNSAAMAAKIDGHIKRCMQLAAKVDNVNASVSTDRAFLAKLVAKDRSGLSRFESSDDAFGGPLLFQPSM